MTKNPWIAAALNVFFPGSVYIYTGRRRLLGAGLLLGALGLTVVGQSASIFPVLGIEAAGLQVAAPEVFGLMLAVVFLMNTVFAVDAYVEARAV